MKLFMVSHLFCSKPCNVVHLKMLCWGNRRFCSKYHASTFSVVRVARKFLSQSIDLSADTAATLNLLDLRSIMGCPGGTRSVFTRAFRAKRELHCIFLGKKAIIITSKHGTTIVFSHYNLFLGKRKEKLARKAGVNSERIYRIVLMLPEYPIVQP